MFSKNPFKRGFKDDKQRIIFEQKMMLSKTTPEPIFDLSSCGLTCLPSGIYSMCRVFRKEVLLICDNRLEELADHPSNNSLLDLAESLKVLNANHNRINKIPKNISNLVNLKELYLSHNQLQDLPDTISLLQCLKVINLKGNNLKQFPISLCRIRGLKAIDVRENRRILALPHQLIKLRFLNSLLFDLDTVKYPSSEVTEQGLLVIMDFLKDESIRDSNDDEIEDRTPFQSSYNRQGSQEDQFDATYRTYINKKDERKKNLVEWETNMRKENEQHSHITSLANEKKRVLLGELLQYEAIQAQDILNLQAKKIQDKASLLKALTKLEEHSNKLIENLNKWQEKQAQQYETLLKIEEFNQQLMLQQGEKVTLKKNTIFKAMLEALKYQYYSDEIGLQGADSIDQIVKNKASSQEQIRQRISEEEYLQREAFEVLQRDKDEQHKLISNQIKLIESELATLTQAEMERRNFKMDSMINNLSEQRSTLASILADLFDQKAKREGELRKMVEALTEKKDIWASGSEDDFWLIQCQKLMNIMSVKTQLKELELKDENLKKVIMLCDQERIAPYLDLINANEKLTFESMSCMSEKDLMMHGIKDYEVAAMLTDKLAEVSNGIKPSAPEHEFEYEEEMITLEPSAPPLKLWCQVECVVCMDSESKIIFLPCGHVCACKSCSSGLFLCPMCRVNIESRRYLII